MWFVLTPILVALGTFFTYRLRRGHTFQGTPDSAFGGYWWFVPKHKGRVRGLHLGVEAQEGFEFTLRQEMWFDRLFKALGLATEFQVQEKDFDRLLYLQSDDPTFLQTLKAGSVRGEIWDLLSLAEKHGYRFDRLCAKGGRLWIELGLGRSQAGTGPAAAEPLVSWLQTFRQHLEQTPTHGTLSQRDPSITRATMLGSIAMGLAVAGTLTFLALAFFSRTWILDTDRMVQAALVFSGLLVAALLALVFVIVGRSARRHLALLEVFFIGGFGAVSSIGGMLHSANVAFDAAPAVTCQATIRGKTLHRGSKGSRSYYLTLTDWTGDAETRRLRVSAAQYGAFREGEGVILEQHPGALGFRWVDGLRRQPPAEREAR